MSFETTAVLLQCTLEASVPLAIAAIQHRGGPTDSDRTMARAWGEELGEKGDQLLFRGPDTARLVSQLVQCTAILAFCPGGIHLLNCHFEAPPLEEHTP
jgi:hypothetical protein